MSASNTPELRQYPEERSLVITAGQATTRAGGIVVNMAYFTARQDKAAGYRRQQVRRADVHAGIIAFRYRSPLRDEPEPSHMEAESAAATEPGLPRPVFLLDQDADPPLPQNYLTDPVHAGRQRASRAQVADAGTTAAGTTIQRVTSPGDLELLLFQALAELRH